MAATKFVLRRIGFVALILLLSSPVFAQIEDQLSAYTGKNGTAYLQPLADALGCDLNDGLFHSAHIPGTGVHINFGIRVMGVIFGDEDKTFRAVTERGFTPPQTVDAPTVVGPGKAVVVSGAGGTSFAFPGGFDLHSFAVAVPQLRVGAVRGTEAILRYFALDTGDAELGNFSLVGLGLRHSLSQYLNQFPVDLAAGFFWQRFKLGDDLINANAFTMGVQASKRIGTGAARLEPYAGLSYDFFSMDVAYEAEISGSPVDIDIDFESSKTAHLTLGLSANLAFLNIHGEYNIASMNSFCFGVSFGN
ncbi:MAG: autotransporter domain-containing protein [Candidatus Krumholzibacteriota bacterium]|nr:autotransporter domain-containing protein [Candidatus Krumholzibacteriota bacterium]